MADEQLGRQMAVADAKLREAVARLLRDDGVGVLAASLALAGLTAELTVDFAVSQDAGDADAALEPAVEFLREQGRERLRSRPTCPRDPPRRSGRPTRPRPCPR